MKNHIILFSLFALIGCSGTKYVSNGSKDNKPLLFEDEYELSNLKELNLEGSAFWGIPKSSELTKEAKNNSGIILTFNGVKIGKSTKLVPILGLLSYTVGVGYGLSTVFGTKQVENGGFTDPYTGLYYPYYEYKKRLPLWAGMIISIPIAGTLNNFTFSNSAMSAAGSIMNYKLITENPEIDLFYYPKYKISNKVNVWTQQASLNAKVKGAKLIIK